MREVESLVISMNRRMGAVPRESERGGPYKICRVLKRIREVDPEAYEPRNISIGPIHHDKQSLQPMQDLKWRFLGELIRRHPGNSVEKYIRGVERVEAKAKNYYSEPVPDNKSFLEMMVLDGCFIIELLLKVVQRSIPDQPYFVKSNIPLIFHDLLLLENQIPFLVLECLFSETRGDLEGLGTLQNIAVRYLHTVFRKCMYDEYPTLDVVHHLLHLFHSSVLPSPMPSSLRSDTSSSGLWAVKKFLMNKPTYILPNCFFYLISLFVTIRPPRRRESTKILSASSLHEVGVKFEINEDARFLLDITFRNGTLKIPFILIDENGASQFRNLLAFDQCEFWGPENHFTSYVALMSSLIQKPEDVKLLEDSGVLENLLGGHNEVVRFFTTLDKGTYIYSDDHYFRVLFNDLNEYCAKDMHRWRAKMMHDYFSNPWSMISLIAAFVLLVLTIVQTFYTIFPYYRPRRS